jgi:hypothetical protein
MVVIGKKRALWLALGLAGFVAVALATGFALSTMTGARSYELPAKERAAWMRLITTRKEKQNPDRAYARLGEEFSIGTLALKGPTGLREAVGGLRDPKRADEAALFISDPAYLYWVTAGQITPSGRDEGMNQRVVDLVHDVHLAVLRQTREAPERRYAMAVAAQIAALDRVFTQCVATERKHEIQQLGTDLLGPTKLDADLVEGFWIGHEAARIHGFDGSCQRG